MEQCKLDEAERIDAQVKFKAPNYVPTTWAQLGQHIFSVVIVLDACFFQHSVLPSLTTTLFMFWYSDIYTAFLHAYLDREESLECTVPLAGRWIGAAARGFQMHHDHPYASTTGIGLYRLMCDTVNIQWLMYIAAAIWASTICGWSLALVQVALLKNLFSAYCSMLAHYYAHSVVTQRPMIVRALQRCWVLVPPRHHVGGHHKSPFQKNFGILSGMNDFWLNTVLTKVNSLDYNIFSALFVVFTLFDVVIIASIFNMLA